MTALMCFDEQIGMVQARQAPKPHSGKEGCWPWSKSGQGLAKPNPAAFG